MRQDFRIALRTLKAHPSFALVAIATLALGIGATTAVFTIVNGILLRPLSYRDPERLVLIRASVRDSERQASLTAVEIGELRRLTHDFAGVSAIVGVEASLTGEGEMEAATAVSATDDFLPLLGVGPALGRHLSARQDIGPTYVRAVEISDELWQRHWHGDPALIGRHIEVNNIDVVVAGIVPRGFSVQLGPGTNVARNVDVWFPRQLDESPLSRYNVVVARLQPGVRLDEVQRDVDAAARRLASQTPAAYPGGRFALHVARLQDDLVQDVRPALVALFGAVGFVLLIACANIAQLLLARGSSRTREIAIRQAIGAGPGRIARQLLTESLTLATAGSVAGLLIARWSVDLLVALAPASLPRRNALDIDLTVIAFTFGAALLSAILFGVAPALQGMRTDVADALKAGAIRSGSRGHGRIRAILIVLEVALSLVLLVGAGLMLRTFTTLHRVPLGFQPRHVLTAHAPLTFRRYDTPAMRATFYRHAIDRIRAMPGVAAVGGGSPLPLHGVPNFPHYSLGSDAAGADRVAMAFSAVPGYFDAMGIRLLAGRDFSWEDIVNDRASVVVDEVFARQSWPAGGAIGQRVMVRMSGRTRAADVIGVAAHVQAAGLRGPALPQFYRAYNLYASDLDLVVRGRGDVAGLGPEIKRAVEALGPGRPVRAIRLLDEYVAEASADTRFTLSVLAAFACAAVVLSAIGLYGVIAYASAGRTREIGIRIALGARTSTIVRLVVVDGLGWALAGIGVGVAGAVAVTRYLETLLFGVSGTDPLTFAVMVAVMLIVAAAASYLPARRAARVDPVIALRAD